MPDVAQLAIGRGEVLTLVSVENNENLGEAGGRGWSVKLTRWHNWDNFQMENNLAHIYCQGIGNKDCRQI